MAQVDVIPDAAKERPLDMWLDSYRRLSGLDRGDLTPEDLEALADVAWLLCRFNESIAARQQAYARYLDGRAEGPAVRSASRLVWEHLYSGETVVALGWLRRARRHLAALPEGAEHGTSRGLTRSWR